MVLVGMAHVVVTIVIILVLVRIFGDAVPVVISAKGTKAGSEVTFAVNATNLPHINLVGVN
jgi:hypothetical protein